MRLTLTPREVSFSLLIVLKYPEHSVFQTLPLKTTFFEEIAGFSQNHKIPKDRVKTWGKPELSTTMISSLVLKWHLKKSATTCSSIATHSQEGRKKKKKSTYWYVVQQKYHLVSETSSTLGCWLQQVKGLNFSLLKQEAKSIIYLTAKEGQNRLSFSDAWLTHFLHYRWLFAVSNPNLSQREVLDYSLWGWNNVLDCASSVWTL